jgi:hypothetical protein
MTVLPRKLLQLQLQWQSPLQLQLQRCTHDSMLEPERCSQPVHLNPLSRYLFMQRVISFQSAKGEKIFWWTPNQRHATDPSLREHTHTLPVVITGYYSFSFGSEMHSWKKCKKLYARINLTTRNWPLEWCFL